MLVLTMKQGDAIFVGPDVTVHFLGRGSSTQVKMGFDAPASVKILRHKLDPERARSEGLPLDDAHR